MSSSSPTSGSEPGNGAYEQLAYSWAFPSSPPPAFDEPADAPGSAFNKSDTTVQVTFASDSTPSEPSKPISDSPGDFSESSPSSSSNLAQVEVHLPPTIAQSNSHKPKFGRATTFIPNDLPQLERLSRFVGYWSFALFAIMLAIVLVGQLVFHRSVGPYVIINIIITALFGFGAFILWLEPALEAANDAHRRNRLNYGSSSSDELGDNANVHISAMSGRNTMRFLQVYFVVLFLMVIVGVPLGGYELSNNSARVDRFCFERNGCSDSQRSSLLAFSYIAGSLSIVLVLVLVTLFMRKVFICICAFVRAKNTDVAAEMVIHPVVIKIARFLPDYGTGLESAVNTMRSCCEHCNSPQKVAMLIFYVIVSIVFLPVSTTVILRHYYQAKGLVAGIVIWLGAFITLIIFCEVYHNPVACIIEAWLLFVMYIVNIFLGNCKRNC